MKRSAVVASTIAASVIALSGFRWFRVPPEKMLVSSASLSSFTAPDYLDEAGFAERLVSTGFVAVTDGDFKSLLPPKYHAAGSAPAQPAAEFATMPAYRHTANSEAHTRIVGYDARSRRVHYYHAQALEREGARGPLVGDEPDTIEEALRK